MCVQGEKSVQKPALGFLHTSWKTPHGNINKPISFQCFLLILPEIIRKPEKFLMISGGIEREHRE